MKIFLDLDETLISSYFCGNNKKEILGWENDYTKGEFYSGYITFVRPTAKRLVDFCRSVVGEENVYVLTASECFYALAISQISELNFRYDKVFSREDIDHDYHFKRFKDKDGNILIDNLIPDYNKSKIDFLNMKDLESYIIIQGFEAQGYFDLETDEKHITNIENKIMILADKYLNGKRNS